MQPVIEAVEHVVDETCELAEGPVWDDARSVLWWLDISGRRVHAWHRGDGENRTLEVDDVVGAIALTTAGGLVAATSEGFAELDPSTGALTPIREVHLSVPSRMNDGKCDRAGRFWAGIMGGGAEPGVGILYRLDGRDAVPTLTGLTIPNGLDWSPDGRTMYYVDSATRRVDAFDFDMKSGTIGARDLFVEVEAPAMPDGLTVDAEGGVWVALWDGAAVHRYTPDGTLDLSVPLPAPEVTSCAFGGPDLDELYITVAALGLFQCRPGFKGVTSPRFKGGAR